MLGLQSDKIVVNGIFGFVQAYDKDLEGSIEGIPLSILKLDHTVLNQGFTEEHQPLIKFLPLFLQIHRRIRIEHLTEDVAQRVNIERIKEPEIEQNGHDHIGAIRAEGHAFVFTVEGVDTGADDSAQDADETVESVAELVDVG